MDKAGAVEAAVVRLLTTFLAEFGTAVRGAAARHAHVGNDRARPEGEVRFEKRRELAGHSAKCLLDCLAREAPAVLRKVEAGEITLPAGAAALEAQRAAARAGDVRPSHEEAAS